MTAVSTDTLLKMAAVVLIGMLPAACGISFSREARYTGTVSPQAPCGRASPGTLTVAGGHFTFAPDDGVLLIGGTVGPDGRVEGQLATLGADKKPFVMMLSAQLGAERLDGTYVTPRCRFTVAFTRVHPDLL